MDATLFSGDPIRDPKMLADRVAVYARRYFRDEADGNQLEDWARAAVADVWGDGVRVTKFVPTLALREVRRHVLADEDVCPAA